MALRRWLVLKEDTDTAWCPDWYPVMVAADVCHCPPWEVLNQSVYWRDKAIIKQSAEAYARKELERH